MYMQKNKHELIIMTKKQKKKFYQIYQVIWTRKVNVKVTIH